MAKTYWQREDINTFTPFQARLSADGVDIYEGQFDSSNEFVPPHPLRNCMTFQWQHAPDLTTYSDISGAREATYTPDTSLVSSSGNYRAVITLGEKTFTTEAETLSVIDCINLSAIMFGQTGTGSRTITYDAPSFETVVVDTPDWITADGTTSPITLTASAGTGVARNAFVDVRFGEFTCSYPVQQGYTPAEPPAATPTQEETTPTASPVIISFAPGGTIYNTGQVVRWLATATYTEGGLSPETTPITWTVSINGMNLTIVPGTHVITSSTQTTVAGFFDATSTEFGTLAMDTDIPIVFTATSAGGSDTKTATFQVTADPQVQVGDEPLVIPDGVVSCDTRGLLTRFDYGGNAAAGAKEATYKFRVDSGQARFEINFHMFSQFFTRPMQSAVPVQFEYTIEGPNVVGGTFTQSITRQPGAAVETLNAEPWNTAVLGTNIQAGTYNLTLRIITEGSDILNGRPENMVQNPYINFSVEPVVWFQGLNTALTGLGNLNFG